MLHLSEIIEGDILVTDNLKDALNARKSRTKRDIVRDMVKRWPDGVVPYKIDSSVGKYTRHLYYALFRKTTMAMGEDKWRFLGVGSSFTHMDKINKWTSKVLLFQKRKQTELGT